MTCRLVTLMTRRLKTQAMAKRLIEMESKVSAITKAQEASTVMMRDLNKLRSPSLASSGTGSASDLASGASVFFSSLSGLSKDMSKEITEAYQSLDKEKDTMIKELKEDLVKAKEEIDKLRNEHAVESRNAAAARAEAAKAAELVTEYRKQQTVWFDLSEKLRGEPACDLGAI